MQVIQSIQNRIYEIRGERIMLDFDLADLYEVATKALNQAVKRNLQRFPKDFMFRLTLTEWLDIRSQSVTASESLISLRSQSVTASQSKRNTNVTPYAFTEQGVAILYNFTWLKSLRISVTIFLDALVSTLFTLSHVSYPPNLCCSGVGRYP